MIFAGTPLLLAPGSYSIVGLALEKETKGLLGEIIGTSGG